MSRACDRCYRIKVRCTFSSNAPVCDRCARLAYSCQTERGLLQVGRPHRMNTLHNPSRPSPSETTSLVVKQCDTHLNRGINLVLSPVVPLRPFASALSNFTTHEVSLIDKFFDQAHLDWFAASVLFGPSFQESFNGMVARGFLLAPILMKDALLACAGALERTRETKLMNMSFEETIKRNSLALQALSTTRVGCFEDAAVSVLLALALLTVNDLAIGQPSLPITRSALLFVSPFRDRLWNSEMSGDVIGILYPEMMECLILREIPVFQYEQQSPTRLDRYYGVCHILLPILYDVCVLGNKIKTSKIPTDAAAECSTKLFTRIDAWTPTLPADREITLQEQEHIMLQASCYRAAGLILCLRMRPQSTSINELAQSLSQRLREAIALQGLEPTSVQYLSFPYFIACLELQDQEQQQVVLFNMNQITNWKAPCSCNAMYEFLRFIWDAQSYAGHTKNWFDLVESGPPLVIGP